MADEKVPGPRLIDVTLNKLTIEQITEICIEVPTVRKKLLPQLSTEDLLLLCTDLARVAAALKARQQ